MEPVNGVKFENEDTKILEGITKIPEYIKFEKFKRIWKTEMGEFEVYEGENFPEVKLELVKEGLKVTLEEKMTGRLSYYLKKKVEVVLKEL